MVLIQINFNFPVEMMGEALTKNAKQLADSINLEEGFVSKIWFENTKTEECGGIYVFKDWASAQKYVEMHTKRVEAMGGKNITCKFFDINETLSKINKGL
ncbi:MAG: hypothetical protein RL662_1965 [Bacteroidota bacterium]|jgi:hypothetical protein